jgi:L-lactate permease
MAGAIALFETMEATYCMPYMMREMKALTKGHPIAELMLMFSFCYMVEGASGFGTPVALGAPMLVSTGHPAFESVVVLLLFNTFATVWGAVGTPIWFGFGGLGLDDDQFAEISKKAAVTLTFCGLILIPMILSVVVPAAMIKNNILFILLSFSSCVGSSLGIAFFSYEFPALLGGLIGCFLTALLINRKIGLVNIKEDHHRELGRNVSDIGSVSEHHGVVWKWHKITSMVSNLSEGRNGDYARDENQEVCHDGSSEPDRASRETIVAAFDEDGAKHLVSPVEAEAHDTRVNEISNDETPILFDHVEQHLGPRKSLKEGYLQEVILRSFPIWACVVLLILTRVQQIGIKPYLMKVEPYLEIYLGSWGTFRISVSAVLQLLNILGYPQMNWEYDVLYVPFILPFILVSGVTILVHNKDMESSPQQIASIVAGRLTSPAMALMGALVLVQLTISTGSDTPAFILGITLSDWFKKGFVVISPLLGALGSFFSGSSTVSNLTFGGVQQIAAESLGTSITSMLALQTVGASAGNGICLSNIIAACAVVGLNIGEGKVLLRTFKFVLGSTTVATIVMLAFYIRFD